jgi:hypothetical protein
MAHAEFGARAAGDAPTVVAAGVLEGHAADLEEIFPDPNAQAMAEMWWGNPNPFERASPADHHRIARTKRQKRLP